MACYRALCLVRLPLNSMVGVNGVKFPLELRIMLFVIIREVVQVASERLVK